MPELPAEAVQAAAEAMGLAIVGKSLNDGTSSSPGFTLEQLAEFGLRAAAPFLVGVGSPASCPSAAPESTQSPGSPSSRAGQTGPQENASESRTAPRGEDARNHTSSHASEHADLAAAIARVRSHCQQVTNQPAWEDYEIGRLDHARQVLGLLDGAGAVPEEQSGPLWHLGGNAEDCPACDITTMPYPFLCPGEEQTGGQP